MPNGPHRDHAVALVGLLRNVVIVVNEIGFRQRPKYNRTGFVFFALQRGGAWHNLAGVGEVAFVAGRQGYLYVFVVATVEQFVVDHADAGKWFEDDYTYRGERHGWHRGVTIGWRIQCSVLGWSGGRST